jgi:rhodanese-related sulfurtransferase
MILPRGRLLRIAMALASLTATAAAQEPPSIPSGPFCGVNSVYTALRAEGFSCDFARLLQPKYVGSASGSTLPELCQAARDSGANAQLVENLRVADLHRLDCPAILHVKSEFDDPDYNHFVLCVAGADGRLALYDAPAPLVRTSGHELAAVWDGTALLVSAEPIKLVNLRTWAAARLALVIGAAVAVAGIIILIRKIYRQRVLIPHSRFGPPAQFLILICAAVLVAAAYHLFDPEGFIAQQQAVGAICAFGRNPDRIELRRTRELLKDGALFVDARRTEDFEHGHIPGAINVPPDASRSDRARRLANRSKAAPLVVYCESAQCPYAGLLARRLSREGFGNVSVFAGGWLAWQGSARVNNSAIAGFRPMEGGF